MRVRAAEAAGLGVELWYGMPGTENAAWGCLGGRRRTPRDITRPGEALEALLGEAPPEG